MFELFLVLTFVVVCAVVLFTNNEEMKEKNGVYYKFWRTNAKVLRKAKESCQHVVYVQVYEQVLKVLVAKGKYESVQVGEDVVIRHAFQWHEDIGRRKVLPATAETDEYTIV